MGYPELKEMRARAADLSALVRHTPMLRPCSDGLEHAMGGAEIWAKAELFQYTGTFKARGALSCVRAIPPKDRRRGITAVSAGNHAIAAAWAARQFGLNAKVVMISSANPLRVGAARAEGAEVVLMPDAHSAFAEVERLRDEEGRTFVHPFEGINTTLGAAGVGLEMMDDVPDLDAVVVSVGGGGLISGVAAAVKRINPDCAVYAVEPDGADSLCQSLAKGEPVTLDAVKTRADSLGAPFALPYGFAVAQACVDRAVTVSDEAMFAGMVIFQEVFKLAVEPAAGAVIAGMLGPLRDELKGKRVGLVVCGANIDAGGYAGMLEEGQEMAEGMLSF